jgi:carboxyl-terminal processing protease
MGLRSRPTVLLLLALLGAFTLGPAGLDAQPRKTPAAAAPPPVVEEVARLVNRHFYDRQRVRQVWPDALATHTADLAADASDEEVDAAIDALLAELGVSHTGRYVPGEVAYYELLDIFARDEFAPRIEEMFAGGGIAYTGIGVVPRRHDGRTFLAAVYHGGPAARAGLLTGDEIVSADGAPFDPVASFAGKQGRAVVLEVRREVDGPTFEVEVVPRRIRPNAFFADALRESMRVIEHEGRSFGYVRVWSYARREYHNLLSRELARGRLAAVDGLVLDLRGGWGGARPEYTELFVGGAPIMTYTGRDGRERLANFRWRRPVVVLVDEGTRSGKEVVTFGLQRHGVPVVGTRTAGALLGGRGYLLRDGSLLVLAVSDVRVEGQRLEGVGVRPDIEVPFTLPYAAGADPQLEAALAELARAT